MIYLYNLIDHDLIVEDLIVYELIIFLFDRFLFDCLCMYRSIKARDVYYDEHKFDSKLRVNPLSA